MVRYAEGEYLAGYTTGGIICGGGGGGGGGGSPPPPDFSISASPASLTMSVGMGALSTITVTSLNGYSGTVSLTTTSVGVGSGMTASIGPSSITLASGGSGSSTLGVYSAASTPIGSYTVTVTGSDGTVSHTVSLSVSVTSDFGITATPVSLTVTGGSFGMSTITLTSIQFSGTISLSAFVVPGVANAPTTSLNPTSVTPPSGGTGTSTLTVTTGNTPSGRYTVWITGSSGSTQRIVSIAITVPFPNDPLLGSQWGLPDLNVLGAWTRTIGTRARVIAIVDSGIYFDHPDLQGNLWTAADGSHGWNCADSPQNNNAADYYGHGTAVAGVAAAVINNGVGIAGVAQEQLMSVRVGSPTQPPTDVTVACGIQWAEDHGANVINISIGVSSTTTLLNAVQYAWNHGALLVAAAGNDGTNSIHCPACYTQVIAVSALQQGDTAACFDNYGTGPVPTTAPEPELTAPGVNILTTNWPPTTSVQSTNFGSCGPNNNPFCTNQLYCAVDGTSFAAPFVSGLAALAWDYNLQKGPNAFTNRQIRMALDSYVTGPSSTNICGTCNNYYGYGKPDTAALLNAMVSPHSYNLTAQWFFGLSHGTEGSAGVLLQDITNSTDWKWITPCCTVPSVGNGLTVSIMAGHKIWVYFTAFFNDGTNWVYLQDVASGNLGGNPVHVPTYSDTNSLACGVNFVFPPVSASSEADYAIAISGNPYAGISCTQGGVAK